MAQGLPDLSRDFRAARMADHAGTSAGKGQQVARVCIRRLEHAMALSREETPLVFDYARTTLAGVRLLRTGALTILRLLLPAVKGDCWASP